MPSFPRAANCRAAFAARRACGILVAALLFCCLLSGAASSATEVYFSPDGGIRQRLVQAIEGSRRTIDLAIYNLTAFELADALQAAQARGVHIRILTDRENLETGSAAIGRLRRGGVPVRVLLAAYRRRLLTVEIKLLTRLAP